MNYFLNRDGENLGPLTQERIDEMRLSGELFEFQWIWKEGAPSWEPIPRKPPLPTAPAATQKAAEAKAAAKRDRFAAILFNPGSSGAGPWSGEARQLSAQGCVVRLEGADESHLPFPEKAKLSLDLLDTEQQLSECVIVEAAKFDRQPGGDWDVQLNWISDPPTLGGKPA